ncbi:MAG: HepT-like ribonuclease domain-containing protein [Planctomycetota bacterium]
MSPDELDIIRTRLSHMIEAVDLIAAFLDDRSADEIREDLKALHAIRSAFMQLGEAANRIPAAYRDQHPAVPWEQIRKYRNFIVHAYDMILVDPLWDTASKHVPPLREPLRAMLDDLPPEDTP